MTREIQKKKQALVDFLDNAQILQGEFLVDCARRTLPPEWDEIDLKVKVEPKKAKITLRLDEDVIKYFRAMGPGYTMMVNAVLRTFMSGRIANTLFVREQSLDPAEILTGYRNKTVEELVDMAEHLSALAKGLKEVRKGE